MNNKKYNKCNNVIYYGIVKTSFPCFFVAFVQIVETVINHGCFYLKHVDLHCSRVLSQIGLILFGYFSYQFSISY